MVKNLEILRNINLGCHGIPNRCLAINGKKMRICARCFGSTIGHIISFLFFILGGSLSYTFSSLIMMPLIIDWSLQQFLKIESNNTRRFTTGIVGGFGVGMIIWKTVGVIIKHLL